MRNTGFTNTEPYVFPSTNAFIAGNKLYSIPCITQDQEIFKKHFITNVFTLDFNFNKRDKEGER